MKLSFPPDGTVIQAPNATWKGVFSCNQRICPWMKANALCVLKMYHLFLHIETVHFQADCFSFLSYSAGNKGFNQFCIWHSLKRPRNIIFRHHHCLKELGTEPKYTKILPQIQSSFSPSSFKAWLCHAALFHSIFQTGYLSYLKPSVSSATIRH